MKTINHPFRKTIFGIALSGSLLLMNSCSTDPLPGPDENLSSVNAKSSKSILKTLAKGSATGMANGITIGADGNLYIGSVLEQAILVMDKQNGNIISRISERVLGADDLVFGPDGSLYWTDILTGEVGRLSPDGSVKKQFVHPGVNPIAFNDDGRLFVALDFQGDGLYELDPELDNPPRSIISCDFPAGPPCLGFFNSFDFGPDGRLYGPLFAFNLVIAVDVGEPGDLPYSGTFGELVANGTIEILAGEGNEFSNPAATKFGPDGLLYVLDQTGKLFTLDTDTKVLTTLTTSLGPGLDNMVFDADGSLYMTNNDDGWVAEILPSRQPRIISPGGMIAPQGLAVIAGPDGQDMVYEADLFSMREFNGTSGRQTGVFKGFLVPVPGVVSLTLPQNVSASGNDLIISSFFSSTVQVWNPQEGVTADYADQVAAPMDAVRLTSGDVIVSDIALGGVFRMTDNAQLFAFPGAASGLATDGESVWAADWGAGMVFQIDLSGGPAIPVVDKLSFPEGLAIDQEGRLIVYETQGPDPNGISKLTRIDLTTGERTTLVEGLEPKVGGIPDFPPQWLFDGVDVGPSGDIYIRGGEQNVIYKIPKNKLP